MFAGVGSCRELGAGVNAVERTCLSGVRGIRAPSGGFFRGIEPVTSAQKAKKLSAFPFFR